MGMTQGSTGTDYLKAGLTGLSQGLANYGNPHPQYDFSKLAEGFQAARPSLGLGTTPGAKKQKGVGGQANAIDNPANINNYLPQSSQVQDDDYNFER